MSGTSIFAALNTDFETGRKKPDSSDGGGGQPKIELSKGGKGLKIVVKISRARSAPRWSTGRRPDKINAVVISNWVRNDKKAAGRLRGALRYNQERERSRDEATTLEQLEVRDCLGGCRRGGQRLLEGPNHIVAAVFPA